MPSRFINKKIIDEQKNMKSLQLVESSKEINLSQFKIQKDSIKKENIQMSSE